MINKQYLFCKNVTSSWSSQQRVTVSSLRVSQILEVHMYASKPVNINRSFYIIIVLFVSIEYARIWHFM